MHGYVATAGGVCAKAWGSNCSGATCLLISLPSKEKRARVEVFLRASDGRGGAAGLRRQAGG